MCGSARERQRRRHLRGGCALLAKSERLAFDVYACSPQMFVAQPAAPVLSGAGLSRQCGAARHLQSDSTGSCVGNYLQPSTPSASSSRGRDGEIGHRFRPGVRLAERSSLFLATSVDKICWRRVTSSSWEAPSFSAPQAAKTGRRCRRDQQHRYFNDARTV